MYQKWTSFLEEFVRNNAHHMTDDTLTQEINQLVGKQMFTVAAVRKKRQYLGVKKLQGRGVCKLQERKSK